MPICMPADLANAGAQCRRLDLPFEYALLPSYVYRHSALSRAIPADILHFSARVLVRQAAPPKGWFFPEFTPANAATNTAINQSGSKKQGHSPITCPTHSLSAIHCRSMQIEFPDTTTYEERLSSQGTDFRRLALGIFGFAAQHPLWPQELGRK